MQGMKKKELVQLVSMGKVVLLLGNDETRYDRQVILDAYKESPDSVIGRRAMNAMMIAQLVEMKNQYAANYPMAYEMASQLAKYGNQKQDEVALHISELLVWPYRVVGESFGICKIRVLWQSVISALISWHIIFSGSMIRRVQLNLNLFQRRNRHI